MTMTETPTESSKKNSRKPTKKRGAGKKAARAVPKHDAAYDGLTPSDCPVACTASRCIISGAGICAHPYKGGLQAMMQSPEAMRRLNEAKRALGKRKLNVVEE